MSEDAKCHQFADYIFKTCVSPDAKYPPQLYVDVQNERSTCIRTTNGPEAFISQFDGHFCSAQQSIFTFIDVITKFQTTTYVEMSWWWNYTLKAQERDNIVSLLKLAGV